jgi:hypothetical protein
MAKAPAQPDKLARPRATLTRPDRSSAPIRGQHRNRDRQRDQPVVVIAAQSGTPDYPHPSPQSGDFEHGLELSVPGSLPLGLSSDEVQFPLHESETPMFITDSVLEARNPQGEFYGFERVAALMTGRPTLEHVVDVAGGFGQEGDITVVSISAPP